MRFNLFNRYLIFGIWFNSRIKMYFLGLAVWLAAVLLAHLAWRLCFIQTQATIVSVQAYNEEYRNITHTNIVISYSYKFNQKIYESSDIKIGSTESSVKNEKQEVKTANSIAVYINRFYPQISYINLSWRRFWLLLSWIGVILALPVSYSIRFFLKKLYR